MKLNEKKEGMRAQAHENYMGGPSYDLSPFARLYVITTSCFFGEKGYYEGRRRNASHDFARHLQNMFGSFGEEFDAMLAKDSWGEGIVSAIEDSLAYDAELTLKYLAWLRKEALIRATPAVGLAVASHNENVRGSGALKAVADDILSRLDDVTNCLAYYLNKYGKPIPNGLKKVLAKRLADASEYELAKYSGKNKKVSLLDVASLTHAHSEGIDKLFKGELSQANEETQTWEGILSKEGASKESWEKAIPVMGHMALLRNLRNFEKHEVDTSLFLDKLVAGVEKGKQLPFRYFSAYQMVQSAQIRDALEKCLDISIKNLPIFKGNSLILVDNSGSALGTRVSELSKVSVSVCGNLMGVLTGLTSEKGKIGVFGDEIKYFPVNKDFKGSALQMLSVVNELGTTVGQATENGIWLALDEITRRKEKYDRLFIYSDMQAGHGGLYGVGSAYKDFTWNGQAPYHAYIDVPKLVARYRKEVSPDCKLYSVQIGGYSDSIFPELYPNTCLLAGWSTELLRFAHMFENNPMSVEDIFRKKLGVPKK